MRALYLSSATSYRHTLRKVGRKGERERGRERERLDDVDLQLRGDLKSLDLLCGIYGLAPLLVVFDVCVLPPLASGVSVSVHGHTHRHPHHGPAVIPSHDV